MSNLRTGTVCETQSYGCSDHWWHISVCVQESGIRNQVAFSCIPISCIPPRQRGLCVCTIAAALKISVMCCDLGLTSRWREHGETHLWVGVGWYGGGSSGSKGSHPSIRLNSVGRQILTNQHEMFFGKRRGMKTLAAPGWITLCTSAWTLHLHNLLKRQQANRNAIFKIIQAELLNFYEVGGIVEAELLYLKGSCSFPRWQWLRGSEFTTQTWTSRPRFLVFPDHSAWSGLVQ